MIEARNTCVLSAIISFLNLLVTLMSDNSQAKTIGMFVSFITSLIREKFLKSPKKNKDRSN